MKAVAAPVIGGILGAKGADDQQDFQAAQTAEQMAFQERMSNTAIQRGVKDSLAAGVNPIFSVAGGGASSPQGASAQGVNWGEAAVKGANSALSSQLLKAQIDNVNAATRKTNTETENLGRYNPLGKFVKQAGDNILGVLDDLPNIRDVAGDLVDRAKGALSNSAKSAQGPLRITVRPLSSARSSLPDSRRLGPPRPGDYIPMPPKP